MTFTVITSPPSRAKLTNTDTSPTTNAQLETELGKTVDALEALDTEIVSGTRVTQSQTDKIQPVTATVAANALTLGLDQTVLDFRSATLTTGVPATRRVASPISLVVPSGATLGTVNGQSARLMVLAIDNAGTVELAVVNLAGGNNLDETTLISTTAISAGATSASTIYSTTSRSSVAFRVVGFVDISEATAGTWGAGPTLVQGCGGSAAASLQSIGYGQTWQTPARSASTTYYNLTGKPIQFVATAILSGAGAAASIVVNGVTLASQSSGGAAWAATMTAIVPPGGSYSFQTNVGVSSWSELR